MLLPHGTRQQFVSIMAGNSRVSRDEDTGIITVQAQLAAFRAALARAVEIQNVTGKFPAVSLALDHRGTFRKQFLLDGLTNSQKRHPKLSQLKPEVVAAFQPVADELGVSLDAIFIIHEDSARTHASHVIQNSNLPAALVRMMKVDQSNDDDDDEDDAAHPESGSCSVGAREVDRVTCAAVTSEYFLSSLDRQSGILEVFFENDIWSQANVYTRGAVVMRELGNDIEVRLRMVDKSGTVLGASKPILLNEPPRHACSSTGGDCLGEIVDDICVLCNRPATKTAEVGLRAA